MKGQRQKARDMMAANGHGDQLKHVSTRIVGPTPSAMNFPNQVVDGGNPMTPNLGIPAGGMPDDDNPPT